MAQKSFDWELLLIVPFSIGAAASLGLVDTNVLPFLDLGETIYEQGNIDFTAGRILAILSLLAVFINRDASLGDTGGIDLWIVYTTIALVLVPPLLPALEDTLAQQPAAIIAFVVQGLGFTFVSYEN
jgi:hypothetical protein